VAAVFLGILFLPLESSVVPEAKVVVVDDSGTPMPNVLVKQQWKDVGVEDQIHVDLVRTNENGVASFPTRKGRSSLGRRLLKVVWRTATQGAHASIWPYGVLTAYANDDPNRWGSVGYNSDTWPKQIQVKRWDRPPLP
jgi:hypothetical protein